MNQLLARRFIPIQLAKKAVPNVLIQMELEGVSVHPIKIYF